MPPHLILLALITLTILDEEYKPYSSSLCRFLKELWNKVISVTSLNLNTATKRCGREVITPASYSGGPGSDIGKETGYHE
jgi:hypothetical protein